MGQSTRASLDLHSEQSADSSYPYAVSNFVDECGLNVKAEMEALDVPRSAVKRTLPWAAQMAEMVDLGAMFG